MENFREEKKLCEICKEIATSLCFICSMYLCDSCFKYIHDKNINKNHKKEKIDYFISFPLNCSEHPKDRINLFCLDENGKLYFLYFYYL